MRSICISIIIIAFVISFPFCKKQADPTSLFGDTSRIIFTNKAGIARAIALDKSGNLFTTDNIQNKIFKVTPDGTAVVFAGTGEAGFSDGEASSATFNGPSGIAVDSHGNVYISDLENHKIRKISTDGNVTTIGSARAYFICIDKNDKLYIADFDRNVVSTMTDDGTETIVAGKPYYTDYVNGLPDEARFRFMRGIGVDPQGNIYVVEEGHRIRKIDAVTHEVSTFVGDHVNGDTWEDGDPAHASFGELLGFTFDAAGNMIIADYRWNRFRKITPGGLTTTFPDQYFGACDAKVMADGRIMAATDRANIYLVSIKK